MKPAPPSMSVAVAQPKITATALGENAIQHAEIIRSAEVRLVVFPELSLTCYDLDAQPIALDDPRLDPITKACKDAQAVAIVGAPVHEGHDSHIGMIRVEAHSRKVVYRKQNLSEQEARKFSAASGHNVIRLDGWRIGLGICKDTGSLQHIAASACQDLDLYIAGLVHLPEDQLEQDARGYVIARTCDCYVAFSSFAGATGGEFSRTLGRSTIWGPEGTVLARAGDSPGDYAALNVEKM